MGWLDTSPTAAQPPPLPALQAVRGMIPAGGDSRWHIEGRGGTRLSLRAMAISGDLIPSLRLLAADGAVIVEGTYPSYRTAGIDDAELPADGLYTVVVAAAPEFASTQGEFALTLSPGFGMVTFAETFDPTATSRFRVWRTSAASAVIGGGRLTVTIQGVDSFAWTEAGDLPPIRDGYYEATMTPDPRNGRWVSGLIFRGSAQGSGGERLNGYVFSVDSNGRWRFAKSTHSILTTIRGWRPLPTPLSETFTLGMRAVGETFTLFVNGAPIFEVADESYPEGGLVGVLVGTDGEATRAAVSFDGIILSQAPEQPPAAAPIEPPLSLIAWEGTPEAILTELRAARMFSSSLQSRFAIPEAYVTNSLPGGIVFTPLGRGETTRDLIYGAAVSWQTDSENTACAFKFRAVTSRDFTFVHLDRQGGVGARQESAEETRFATYDLFPAVRRENEATNRVLIVAIGNGLVVYVNGERVIHANATQGEGVVSVAAYNYEKARTVCLFSRVWLQSVTPFEGIR